MELLKTKYGISHKLLFLTLAFYAVNYISGGVINTYIALVPSLVSSNFELWRMLTFPFAMPSIESIILFIFAFYFIAPKIEYLLPGKVYPILLGLLVTLQGLVTTITFRNSPLIFTGMDGLSFFIMFLFAFISLSNRTLPYRFKPLKTGLFIFLMAGLWTLSLLLNSEMSNTDLMITSSSGAVFGIIYAFVTFLQVKIAKRNIDKQTAKLPENIKIPTPEELKYAIAHISEKRLYNRYNDIPYEQPAQAEFVPDEDRLNEILDKISEFGQDSLSNSELQYLKDYSDYL